MYWLYVVTFVCVLLVPRFVVEGWLPQVINREVSEIIYIFVFSTLAFVLYIIRDYQWVHQKKELEERRKEGSRLTRELASSYSYIGEVNRRVEILQEVTLDMPELLENGNKEGKNIYHDVLRAIQIFSGCQDFVVILHSPEKKKKYTELCLPNSKTTSIAREINLVDFIGGKKTQFTKEDGTHYSVVKASGTISNVYCLGVFQRNSLRSEVTDLIRPLLMQILFLSVYSKNISSPKENF